MKFSKNFLLLLSITGLIALYALLYTLSIQRLVLFPTFQLMLDGMLGALLYFGLYFLLWRVMKYANIQSFDIYQRFINYSVLGFLIVFIWSTANYGLSHIIFGTENIIQVEKIVPFKAFIAFLIYLVIIQLFKTKLSQTYSNNEIELASEEVLDESAKIEEDKIQLLERIVIKTGQKIDVIYIEEIVYFQSEGDYVRIITDTGKYLKEETMKYFQIHLSEKQFVRVHRSYLVNISKILRIELYEKQYQQLTLNNGDKLRISASGYKKLREILHL